MQFLAEYGIFLAKAVTIVFAALIIIGSIISAAARHKKTPEQNLEVTYLNKEFDAMEHALASVLLTPHQFKARFKAAKKTEKQLQKGKAPKRAAKKGTTAEKKRVYVLDFDGDLRATAVESLRQEISAILTMAQSGDEVVVRLESPGGAVHGYGLAASQLQRIRERKIPLTICVDKVAASGGYLMACVADRLIAAPFAVIGSIGVVTQLPNFSRLLKKHEIDFEQLTAGEYKRTLTLFGKNTPRAREKVRQELEEIHALFKRHVKTQRPKLNINKVATGEHWLGSRALELGLVDHLQTSDDYLMAQRQTAQIIALHYTAKKNLMERIADRLSTALHQNPHALPTPSTPIARLPNPHDYQ